MNIKYLKVPKNIGVKYLRVRNGKIECSNDLYNWCKFDVINIKTVKNK